MLRCIHRALAGAGKSLFLLGPLGQADRSHVVVDALGQRLIGQEVPQAEEDGELGLGLRAQRGVLQLRRVTAP
jgi:hypothetical protein